MVLKPVKPVEQPEQPSPVTITVATESATVTISLGNGLFLQQVIPAQTMDEVSKLWRESRRQLAQQQQLIADVIRTKQR